MLGEWTCIAYVENVDDFDPEQELPQEMLFLKGIALKSNGIAVWTFGKECNHTAQWDAEKITSILERPASCQLKELKGDRFLFVEWISNDVTILNRKPGYYVLKKSPVKNDEVSLESDPVGKWTVVDFVQKIEDFDPKHRSLNVLPSLRRLYFQKMEQSYGFLMAIPSVKKHGAVIPSIMNHPTPLTLPSNNSMKKTICLLSGSAGMLQFADRNLFITYSKKRSKS